MLFAAHTSRLAAAAVCRKHVSLATLEGGGRPDDPHHLDPSSIGQPKRAHLDPAVVLDDQLVVFW